VLLFAILAKIEHEKVTHIVLRAIVDSDVATSEILLGILRNIESKKVTNNVLKIIEENLKTTTHMQLIILSGIRQDGKVSDSLFKRIVLKLDEDEQFRAIELPEELYNAEVLKKIKDRIKSLELTSKAIQLVANKIESMLNLQINLVEIQGEKHQVNQVKYTAQNKRQTLLAATNKFNAQLEWINRAISPFTEQVDSKTSSKIETSSKIMKHQ
jgi:hypothetical protein